MGVVGGCDREDAAAKKAVAAVGIRFSAEEEEEGAEEGLTDVGKLPRVPTAEDEEEEVRQAIKAAEEELTLDFLSSVMEEKILAQKFDVRVPYKVRRSGCRGGVGGGRTGGWLRGVWCTGGDGGGDVQESQRNRPIPLQLDLLTYYAKEALRARNTSEAIRIYQKCRCCGHSAAPPAASAAAMRLGRGGQEGAGPI